MPNFKKIGSRIYGTEFNTKEQDAINREIFKQLAEYDRTHVKEIDALVLWELREMTGFGYKRLKEFYMRFGNAINSLLDRYELKHDDSVWLAQYKLKEIGIDLDEWEEERKKLDGDT